MSTITAQITITNDGPKLVNGRETFEDLVVITDEATDEVLGEVWVESTDDAAPYDVAVRSIIGDMPFVWA